jgi:hypothetical protein
MATPTKYGDLDLVKLNNAIAKRHKEVEKVESFRNEDDAKAIITTALQTTGERFIRILKPDYVKRGKAAERWARYKDGMLAEDYIEKAIAEGDTRAGAVRDIRYNEAHDLIKVYG